MLWFVFLKNSMVSTTWFSVSDCMCSQNDGEGWCLLLLSESLTILVLAAWVILRLSWYFSKTENNVPKLPSLKHSHKMITLFLFDSFIRLYLFNPQSSIYCFYSYNEENETKIFGNTLTHQLGIMQASFAIRRVTLAASSLSPLLPPAQAQTHSQAYWSG